MLFVLLFFISLVLASATAFSATGGTSACDEQLELDFVSAGEKQDVDVLNVLSVYIDKNASSLGYNVSLPVSTRKFVLFPVTELVLFISMSLDYEKQKLFVFCEKKDKRFRIRRGRNIGSDRLVVRANTQAHFEEAMRTLHRKSILGSQFLAEDHEFADFTVEFVTE